MRSHSVVALLLADNYRQTAVILVNSRFTISGAWTYQFKGCVILWIDHITTFLWGIHSTAWTYFWYYRPEWNRQTIIVNEREKVPLYFLINRPTILPSGVSFVEMTGDNIEYLIISRQFFSLWWGLPEGKGGGNVCASLLADNYMSDRHIMIVDGSICG